VEYNLPQTAMRPGESARREAGRKGRQHTDWKGRLSPNRPDATNSENTDKKSTSSAAIDMRSSVQPITAGRCPHRRNKVIWLRPRRRRRQSVTQDHELEMLVRYVKENFGINLDQKKSCGGRSA
jgi:hypothetical protein